MGRASALSIVLVLVATPAAAQWTWNPAPMNAINADVQRQGMMANINAQVAGQIADLDVSTSKPRQIDSSVLSFKMSGARRRANYAAFVEKTRATDPAGAAQLAADLRKDPLRQIAPQLASLGLNINNVADAYASYWAEAWEAAHRRPVTTSSPQQIEAVKQQAAEAILATPEMTQASDADKQQFAEALWLQTLGLSAAREQAQGNPQQLQAIAGAVRKGARSMGLDLDAMTLTEQGFVPAGKKVGAQDDAPGQRSANVGSGLLVGATLAGLGFGSLWLMKGQSSRGGG